jgi:hypothetical protein
VAVIGSWARSDDHPADRSSDVDVLLAVTNPKSYLATGEWVRELGEPWLTYVEIPPIGGTDQRERRVVFDGALEVDFALVAARDLWLGAHVLATIRRFPPAARLLSARIAD